MARRPTGREIDTRDLSEAERTEANKELARQMNAADRQTMRELDVRDREAVRQEKWRLRPFKNFTPD